MITKIKELSLRAYHNQFFRFLLIGGVNVLFSYSIFALLIFIRLHYSLASLFATVLSVLFNFKTTGYFVFKNQNSKLIFHFVSVYTLIYFLNLGFLAIFNYFKVSNYIAGAVLILPMAAISFLLNKYLVFRKLPNNVKQQTGV